MSLNVQNDLGTVSDANSYATIQEFKDYWTDRGVDYTATSEALITSYLIPALSYQDFRFVWAGYKTNGRDQTTEFPREDLYDCSGETPELVSGVPRECKDAQCEYAHIYATQGTLQPNGSINGNVKRVKRKVGPIEREYEYSPPGEAGAVVAYPQADNKIPDCFTVNTKGLAVHV